MEAARLARTRRALDNLLGLAPSVAVVLRGGEQVEVLARNVEVGEPSYRTAASRRTCRGRRRRGDDVTEPERTNHRKEPTKHEPRDEQPVRDPGSGGQR